MTTPSRYRSPFLLFVFVLALIVGRFVFTRGERLPSAERASLVKWVPEAEAVRLARENGRPIMYEFTADWCPPCKQMESQVFAHAATAEQINKGFVPVRLMDRKRETGSNPPDVSRLQNLYRVRAFPTIIFVDPEGNLKRRLEGYGGRAAFERELAALAR